VVDVVDFALLLLDVRLLLLKERVNARLVHLLARWVESLEVLLLLLLPSAL
jgi:hypothetical protein